MLDARAGAYDDGSSRLSDKLENLLLSARPPLVNLDRLVVLTSTLEPPSGLLRFRQRSLTYLLYPRCRTALDLLSCMQCTILLMSIRDF
jgi:hypothetical protein